MAKALAEKKFRKWFAKFKAEDLNLEDQEFSDRPSTTDEDQIEKMIETNPDSETYFSQLNLLRTAFERTLQE